MSQAEVVDLEAEEDVASEPADEASSDHKGKRRKVSSVYESWQFELAEMRDKSHRGAQCLPCKHLAESKGLKVDPKGTCLAELSAILVRR